MKIKNYDVPNKFYSNEPIIRRFDEIEDGEALYDFIH